MRLLADGKDAGKELKLNAGNGWRGSFDDLRKYKADGSEIAYTVTEAEVSGVDSSKYGTAVEGAGVVEELMQGRIEQTHDDRQPVHGLEHAVEVAGLRFEKEKVSAEGSKMAIGSLGIDSAGNAALERIEDELDLQA